MLNFKFLNRSLCEKLKFKQDSPRFSYRGLMIDPARNFIPKDQVISILEVSRVENLFLSLLKHHEQTLIVYLNKINAN